MTGDSEKAIQAIATWVAEYNKTIELLSPEYLDDGQKDYLDPISDDERSSMTYDELTERLELYEQYNKQETIRKDSNFRSLLHKLRTSVFTQVSIPDSTLQSIVDLGIGTGEAGNPISDNYNGKIVMDSTDADEILGALQEIEDLTSALEEDDYSVYKLFAQKAGSEVQLKASTALDDTTPLANDIDFSVSDGTNTATITLPSGTTGASEILGLITNALTNSELGDIKVSFDASGHLQFISETDEGRAYIRILDLTDIGETDRLSTRLGITGGTYAGNDAADTAGSAEKSYAELREATGVSGFISQKAIYGGNYSQGTIFDEIVELQERILRLEDRLAQREKTLLARYTAMETSLANLQSQQSALSQLMGTAASATFTNS